MKKKILLIALAALVAGFLALAGYVQSEAFSLKVTPRVRSYVESNVSRDVLLGKVKAGLIPLYLEIRDIVVLDDERMPSVTVRKARAYINPLALLLGWVRISRVTLVEPQLTLGLGAGGVHNYGRLVELLRRKGETAPARDTAALKVDISGVSVRRGSLVVSHQPTSSRVVVSDLFFVVRGNIAKGTGSLAIRNADVRVSAGALRQQDFALKAFVRYDEGTFDIRSLSLLGSRASVDVFGRVGSSPSDPADLVVRASIYLSEIDRAAKGFARQRQELMAPAVDLDASVQGLLGSPVCTGSAHARNLLFRNARVSGVRLDYVYKDKMLTFRGKQWKMERRDTVAVLEQVMGEISHSESAISINQISLAGAGFAARAGGRIDLKKGYAVDMVLETTDAGKALGVLSPVPAAGAAGVRGRWTGALGSPRFDGRLSAGPLRIRGVEFSRVDGVCEISDRKVIVRDAEIRQASSRYLFNGAADLSGDEIRYDARLDVIRSEVVHMVSLFYKPIPLDVLAKGEILFSGTARQFGGTAYLVLSAGKAYGETFSSGTVTATLEPRRIVFPAVEVYKGSGVVKGSGWIGFDRQYAASVQARYVDLSEVDIVRRVPLAGAFKLDIESSGPFANPSVQASLEIDTLTLATVPMGRSSAEFLLQDHGFTLSAQNADGLFGGQWRLGLRKPYPWSASLDAHLRDIALLLEPRSERPGPSLRASLDGALSASGTGFSLSRVSGEADIEHLRVELGEYVLETTERSRLAMRDGTIDLRATSLKGQATDITVSARMHKTLDLAVQGTTNMSLLRLLYREIEHSEGGVDFRISIDDALHHPVINGDVMVRGGALKVRDIPQTFTGLNGSLSLTDGRIVAESVSGELGGGGLQVSGWLQMSGYAVRDFALRARSTGVTVRYPEGVVSTLSGDVYYDGNAHEQTLSGEVVIANARYEKRIEWKTMLVEMARGIYQRKKTEIGWIGDTQLSMRFHGKEAVMLQNNLAKVPLDVDIQLRGTINRPQLLGRLEASRGSVFFRNTAFTVLHASADFVDPNRLNPVLDIQAETRVREYLIRLSVSGTAEQALVTFLSDPPLSDADILGVLALGKTGSELKGREAGVGMGEAVSFATGQFQDIFEQRARSLTGLDRFQVDPYVSTGDTSVPRVTVGKEIVRDKLYVTYSSNVGSTDAEPILKVEYLLNRNVSIVGEQDDLGKIGADMKFRFEFR